MYTGMLHTHTLVVGLFLILYVIKTLLLLFGSAETLSRFTAKTKVAEMVISTLFLATGAFLYFNSGNITWMVNLKIALVLASIPLAIVGFKKRKSALAVLSLFLLFGAYVLAEMNKRQATRAAKPEVKIGSSEIEAGKNLYVAYCQACHGENGGAGRSGAKNLQITTLPKAEMEAYIRIGKGAMPGFSNLSQEEIEAIILYTDTFRQK
jgi:mono/diheme cytochrome c family protein